MTNETIRWFNHRKRIGFIKQQDGTSAAMHHFAINYQSKRCKRI